MPCPIRLRRLGGLQYPNIGVSGVRGNSQYAEILDGAQVGLNPGTSNFSIEFWFNTPQITSAIQTICQKGAYTASASDAAGYFVYVDTAGHLNTQVGDNSGANMVLNTATTTTMAISTWYHVAINLDRAANITAYINTVAQNTTSIATENASMSSTNSFMIGCRQTNDLATRSLFLNATVDSLAFRLRLLTVAEITASYNNGIGMALRDVGDRSNLSSWWNFDGTLNDGAGSNHLTNRGLSFSPGKR